LSGLLRRVSLFGTKQSDLIDTPQADPLQNCTSLNVNGGPIYFGDVHLNTSVTRYFTISNPNCCPVDYSVGGGAYGFSITPTSGQVPANGSVSISITFTPYYAQYYSGYASVSPGGGTVNFTGRGVQ